MVRHIVLFQLKAFPSAAEKQAKMQEMKEALEALTKDIPFLRAIRVDFNINPDEVFDVILTADLDSLADVKAYSAHSAHQAVLKNIIAPIKVGRACVDFVV
ncbi:MAG: Dabb family protein [Tannerella sp.]|jgi:hypothetical protein|nr:Dabb family protein [Tannerella sp.]